ncbi:MAG TPA: formylglycine-generating enzyme family protein, partial [Burkholderiaceae bacterium]
MRPFTRWRAAVLAGLAAACGLAAAADYAALPGGPFTSVLPQGATPDSTASTRLAAFSLRATPVTRGEYRAFLV